MARRSLGSLTLDLIAKIGGFQQGMDQAARVAETRSRRISNTMRGLGRTVTGVFAALGGAALIRGIIRASIEQENALRQLEQRIKSTGGAAGKTASELTGFASSLQKVTTFGDEAIVEMQGLLLAFTNIRGDVFDRTTEAVLDLSVALGQDLSASAKLVGLALNNPVEGLSRLSRAGISLDDSQKKLIKRLAETGDVMGAQNLLLDELAKRYGGSARTAADTFGGSIEQLKNAFGDLLEGGGGVNETKRAIQQFTEILQDPATVQAAQDVTRALFEGLAAVVPLIREVVEGFRALGGSASEVYKLDLQIELLQRKLRGEGFGDIPGILNLGWIEDAPIFIAGSRALQREIDRLIAKRDELVAPAAVLGGPAVPTGGASTGLLPASEEFLKLEAQIKEQIALFGKTGAAAKIAYEIQSGALSELSTAEQQQVLRLAQQYDALTRSAEAAKKLKDAFDQQADNYQRQIGLIDAVTEADKLRFELAEGNLKDLTAAQGEYLLSFARQIDAAGVAQALEEINLQLLDIRGNTSEAISIRFDLQNEDLMRQLQQLGDSAGQAQLATLRELTIAQADFNELRVEATRITEELALQEERIRNSQETGANTELEAMHKIGIERTQAVGDLQAILAEMEAIAAASGNPQILADVERFRAEIEKLQAQTNLLVELIEGDLKDSFADAFGDFVKGTKSAGEAFKSFIEDIRNRWLDLIAQNLAEKLFGGISGGASGGGGWAGAIGTFLGAAFGGARATGGPVTAGKIYRVNEREPEYFKSNTSGEVVPLSKMLGMGGGMQLSQHFAIAAPEGRVSRQTQQQIAAAAARGVADASRRNN
ncbi:MAG: phage tail length tape measure family protein [Steroidobacteraceae bacterium]